jgi:hypothetical protein
VPIGRPDITPPSDPEGSGGTASTGGSDGTETPMQLAELWKRADPGSGDSLTTVMVAIALAESSGKDDADNGIAAGLWQINYQVHTQWTATQLYDPETNASAAVSVYKSQGLSAWTTYTSGAYKQFIATAKQGTSNAKGTGPDVAGDIGGAINDAADLASDAWDADRFLGDLGSMFFTEQGQIRLLKVGAGILLGVFALHSLFEGSVIGDAAGKAGGSAVKDGLKVLPELLA